MNLESQASFSLRAGLGAAALARQQQPARPIVARNSHDLAYVFAQPRSRAQSNDGFRRTGCLTTALPCSTPLAMLLAERPKEDGQLSVGVEHPERQLHQASLPAAGRLLTPNDTKAVGYLVRGVRRSAARIAGRKIRSTENSAVSAGLPRLDSYNRVSELGAQQAPFPQASNTNIDSNSSCATQLRRIGAGPSPPVPAALPTIL